MGIGMWLIIAAVSGIAGNRADAALFMGIKYLANRFQQGDIPQNQELQIAAARSFFNAQISFISECRKEINNQRTGGLNSNTSISEDLEWLKRKEKQLKTDLKNLEGGNLSITPITHTEDIQSLLVSDEVSSEANIQAIREKISHLVRQENPPEFYLTKVEQNQTGLFEVMCSNFAIEINNNQKLSNILQTLIIKEINNKLQENKLTLENIVTTLENFVHSQKDYQDKKRDKPQKILFKNENWTVDNVNQAEKIKIINKDND